MKRTLLRILPSLVIGISLIVSALIFEKGMRDLAGGLYDISYSVRNVADSAEKTYQEIQDFPSSIDVYVRGKLQVLGSIGTY